MDALEQYIRGGLARAGVEVDPVELEIMRHLDGIFGPELESLATADLRGIWPEAFLDLSQPPRD